MAFASKIAAVLGLASFACGGSMPAAPRVAAPSAREHANLVHRDPRAQGARGGSETKEAETRRGGVVLAFAGDVIAHEAVRRAADLSGAGYASLLEGARPAFEGADLAFVNLESPVSDRSVRRGQKIFHADQALLVALVDLGVNVVSLANNHAFDQGAEGLKGTLSAVEHFGLIGVGAGTTMAAACAPTFLDRGGIRIALFARTLVTNFDDGGQGAEICMLAEGTLKRAARAARAQGADVVIASLHWGNEYEREPRREQVDAAHRLVSAGVDLVIGHHPHVLQRVERLRGAGGRDALIAYSLGNFLSNQGYAFDENRLRRATPSGHTDDVAERGGDTRDAAVLRVVLEKDETGKARIVDVSGVPLWTAHAEQGRIELVPATSRRGRIAATLRVPLLESAAHAGPKIGEGLPRVPPGSARADPW